jgi:hypothetical protein
MNVTKILFEELEPGSVSGFTIRVHAIGTGFERRAMPLLARVGEQAVEKLIIAPDGNGFSGFLAQPPAPEDRLFVHYADEPELDPAEDVEPPQIA